jgi:hypothetical protein
MAVYSTVLASREAAVLVAATAVAICGIRVSQLFVSATVYRIHMHNEL